MNSFAPVDPKLIDVFRPQHDGYPTDMAAGDTLDVLWDVCGDASREFPQELWIEPDLWEDKARDNDKYGTWPLNYVDRFTNQNPTHECTCHSLRTVAEVARNRARGVSYGGPKAGVRLEDSAKYGSVWLSPLSIYAEANPRQWGGASVRGVLDIAIRRGFLPDKIQPRDYGFKHVLHGTTGKGGINQSSGPWVALSRFPEGWQDTGLFFRPLEVIFPESAEQIVCLVEHGYAVGVGRSGHAIPYSIWNPVERLMGYIDSYDIVRWDSWRTVQSAVGGAFTIASMNTPDYWMKPAEEAG